MSRKDAHALGRAIGLALFLVLQGGWIATLVNASDPTAELLGRDWSAFSVAGEKMLSGRSSEVYPVDFSTWPNPRLPNNLAYLYPPFSLYLTLPLGALPPFVAWALCWIVQLGSFAAALILLHRVVGASRDDLMPPAMLAAGSAVLQAVLVIGQISATLLLCFTAGLWAWRQGRAFWAGLAWACLLVKPNGGPTPCARCAVWLLAGPGGRCRRWGDVSRGVPAVGSRVVVGLGADGRELPGRRSGTHAAMATLHALRLLANDHRLVS